MKQPKLMAFNYYGGKIQLAEQILRYAPLHTCWVELFCGSAALTMAKKAAPLEIINDIDGDVVNVFRQLRENPDELICAIVLTPYSREELQRAIDRPEGATDIDRARLFLCRAMMMINGIQTKGKGSFSFSNGISYSGVEQKVYRWKRFPEKLVAIAERLKCVRIENRDARELLRQFANRPATLVYADPPYNIERASAYVHDAKEDAFHIELLDLCNSVRCMVMLSGYDNPLYRDTLTEAKGWELKTIDAYTAGSNGVRKARQEHLWLNCHAAEALRTGAQPVTLTRYERDKRIVNPERIDDQPGKEEPDTADMFANAWNKQ